MPATLRATSRRDALGGYVLIEVIGALAVIAMVVGIVLPWVSREPGAGALEAKAYEVASIFRDDRFAAISGRREVVSRVDLTGRLAISGSRDRAVRIPDSVGIDLIQSEKEALVGGGGIRFYPDGRASGGVVTLQRGDVGYRVTVNWLTSVVDVTRVQPGVTQ
jgi:general secretion pathway protein H